LVDTPLFTKEKEDLQKEINQMMSGMQNPSLPSAARLAAIAQDHGYTISAAAKSKLEQVEKDGWWQV